MIPDCPHCGQPLPTKRVTEKRVATYWWAEYHRATLGEVPVPSCSDKRDLLAMSEAIRIGKKTEELQHAAKMALSVLRCPGSRDEAGEEAMRILAEVCDT